MKRLASVIWCIGSIALWLAFTKWAIRIVVARIWYDFPVRFCEIINDGLLWTLRRFKPAYDPGVLQMQDAGLLVLCIATGLICAAIVFPASAFAWKRIVVPRIR
jgi:hypothetical protein